MSPQRGLSLRAVEVAVTSRCNFRCDYCCAYDLNETRVLSPSECIEILRDLPDLQRVKLSGGEVTLRFEDCVDLISWCSSRGIHTQINTNGTLLDAEKIDRLAGAGLNVAHFSLNHFDAETHSRFYRVRPVFFEKIVSAIELSARHPQLDTVIETILFRETEKTLAEVHHFGRSLGARKHEIQMEIPGVHAGYESCLSPEAVSSAIVSLLERRLPDMSIFFSCLSAYFGHDNPHLKIFEPHLGSGVEIASCIEGRSQLHLHSNGDVMICELGCPEVIGNVFERPLQEIFDSMPEKLRLFLASKHDEESYRCFRHCDSPGETKTSLAPSRLLSAVARLNGSELTREANAGNPDPAHRRE